MKGPFALRLIAAAAIVLVTFGAMYGMKLWKKPKEVVFPAWCYQNNDPKKELAINLPLEFGSWMGQKTELDKKIFAATGAKVAEDRMYAKDAERPISLHIAMWNDPETGLWHNPLHCYQCNGWQQRTAGKKTLPIDQSPQPEVYSAVWTHESGRKGTVVYWYQLGDNILYDRYDLGMARLALRGRETWPPLIKVLIHADGDTAEDSESALDVAKNVYQWINQPSHKTGLGDSAPAKPSSSKAEKSKNPAKEEKK